MKILKIWTKLQFLPIFLHFFSFCLIFFLSWIRIQIQEEHECRIHADPDPQPCEQATGLIFVIFKYCSSISHATTLNFANVKYFVLADSADFWGSTVHSNASLSRTALSHQDSRFLIQWNLVHCHIQISIPSERWKYFCV